MCWGGVQEADTEPPSRREEDAHIWAAAYKTGWRTCLRRPRISLGCNNNAVNVQTSSYMYKHTPRQSKALAAQSIKKPLVKADPSGSVLSETLSWLLQSGAVKIHCLSMNAAQWPAVSVLLLVSFCQQSREIFCSDLTNLHADWKSCLFLTFTEMFLTPSYVSICK